MAMTSVIITTMTMSTSTLIIIIIIVIIIVIASAGGVILPTVALVLSPIIVLLAPSSALGASIVGSCRVCSLYNYLCSFHYDNNYLSLHNVPLLQGDGEVAEAAVEIFACLYLIAFLLSLLYF